MNEQGYILIFTEDDLRNIRNNVTAKYKLTNDIHLSREWVPVGTQSVQFSGTLDGAGFSITGFNITSGTSTQNRGLFAFTSGATIRNLNIVGGNIQRISITNTTTGSFIGNAMGTLLLENCKSSVNVAGDSSVGGFVGRGTNPVIRGCEYSGKLTGTGSAVGGIIGFIDGNANNRITQCRVVINDTNMNQATKNQAERITGVSNVGGIAGSVTGTVISECFTAIAVVGTGNSVGGIAGLLQANSEVSDCYSTGFVRARQYLGGIVGNTQNTTNIRRVERCYSTGNVNNTSTYTGGIIGHAKRQAEVRNCYAIGAEIRGTAVNTIGRILGLRDSSAAASGNMASNELKLYANNVLQNLSATTDPRHGSDIAVPELSEMSTYKLRDWNFTAVWTFTDKATYPYPILKNNLQWSSVGSVVPTLSLSLDEIIVKVGETQSITASGMIANDRVIWSSANNNTFELIPNGNTAVIKGINASDTLLRVTTELGAERFVRVRVVSEIVSTLAVALTIGQVISLVKLVGTALADMRDYTWSSNNSSVAEVNDSGRVIAVGDGVVRISASNGIITRHIDIFVADKLPVPIQRIEIVYGDDNILNIDTPYRPRITIFPEDHTQRTFTWTTSDCDVVMITASNGRIFASEPGEATIKVFDAETGVLFGEVTVRVIGERDENTKPVNPDPDDTVNPDPNDPSPENGEEVGYEYRWSDWGVFGDNKEYIDFAVESNHLGYPEVFALSADGNVYHKKPRANSDSWSNWSNLNFKDNAIALAVGKNQDGRLEAFVLDKEGALSQIWQTNVTKGTWSNWQSMGGEKGNTAVAVGSNEDGRLEVFVINEKGNVRNTWQPSPNHGPWKGWGNYIVKSCAKSIKVGKNQDGRLEIFVFDCEGVVHQLWQPKPNSGPWTGWETRTGEKGCTAIDVTTNIDGQLGVLALNGENDLIAAWQPKANHGPWTPWMNLNFKAAPNVLALAKNINDKLEAFVTDEKKH